MGQDKLIKEIDGKTCVSTAFLAYAFDVSAQAIAGWEKRGCPKVQRGFWYLPEVIKWRDDSKKDECEAEEEMSPAAKKLYWEAEHKKSLTEAQRLKNQVALKEYLPQKEVTEKLASFFITLKQSLLGVPRTVRILTTPYVSEEIGKKIEAEARLSIEHALNQWSEGDFGTGLDQGSLEGTEAAGEFNSEPVGRQVQDP